MNVWEFNEDDGFDPAVALDGLAPPNWSAREVSSQGDVVTLQLDAGAKPSLAGSTRYYLEKRGPYRMLRHEVWPGAPKPRVLVTMRAWPRRGVD